MPPSVQRLCVDGSGPNVSVMRLGGVAQRIEDDARLDAREPLRRIDLQDPVHVLREVEHDRDVAALAGEARAGAPRQDGRAIIAGTTATAAITSSASRGTTRPIGIWR